MSTGTFGAAAIVAAVEAADAGTIDRAEAVRRVRPADIEAALHGAVQAQGYEVLTVGLGASPGAATGEVCFTADQVLDAADENRSAILVCEETTPADEIGMRMAEGIITAKGGLASHAAVVARGWGIPAVCGADALQFGSDAVTVGSHTLAHGDTVTIDGSSGELLLGEVDVSDEDVPAELEVLLGWADEIRGERMAVRANADTGADATRARTFGAEGIGLCRTEHMFLGDRLPVVQQMILASGPEAEAEALDALHVAQLEDFIDVLEAMDGLPVTVRLLDPPLHEFLPDHREAGADPGADEGLAVVARHWAEQNPMLGTRGVRLGIVKDGLYRMQVRALLDAAIERLAVGGDPIVEIMIPLVATEGELRLVREWVLEEVHDAEVRSGRNLAVTVGTMVETPRAALCAHDIARHADFFSFGTNDLTQMVFGFSRDDVASRVIVPYLERGLLDHDPFETIDVDGVGQLVASAAAAGRDSRPELKVGICGEHGGDPESIEFFVGVGLDYVSCSPFRVPVARLAIAQALLGDRPPRPGGVRGH